MCFRYEGKENVSSALFDSINITEMINKARWHSLEL